MLTIYGIKNCDTMRKAFKWLDDHDISYQFHDYRKDGLTEEMIQEWIDLVGLEQLINKRSATWRTLSDEVKENILDPSVAIKAILEAPTLIKRPLLIQDKKALIGFNAEEYKTFLQI